MRRMGVESVAELVRVCVARSAAALAADQATSVPAPASPLDGPIRVLVVEDQPLFRDMLVGSLTAFGHHVIGLENGHHLDQAFDQHRPHVLILDQNLGTSETGLQLAARIRQKSRCGIVFMSSNGRVEDRVAALERGADAYFVKPVSFVELNAVLKNLSLIHI